MWLTNGGACLSHAQARLRRETPFICNIKFANEIPEPPSDPKLLVSEWDPRQMGGWALSSESPLSVCTACWHECRGFVGMVWL